MKRTPEEYTQMGMVLLALGKIEQDQREHLGEVVGGTEDGIWECIQHFDEEDYARAERIGRRLEVEYSDQFEEDDDERP